MFWIVFGVGFLGFMAFLVIRTNRKVNSWEYRFRKDRGVYYFEDEKLILNASSPQKPIGVPVEEIDHIVFTYDIKSVEMGKYTLGLSIVKKDGTATKSLGFVIASYINPLDPHDAAKDLEAHGIRCELPTGRGTFFGNRSE